MNQVCAQCGREFEDDNTVSYSPCCSEVCYKNYTKGCTVYSISNGIPGIGPNAPIVENAQGGKQAILEYAFTLLDPKAIFALAKVLYEGEKKHGRDNWRQISTEEHLNHALMHCFAYLAGDKQDEHLAHAFCRLMMALAVEK